MEDERGLILETPLWGWYPTRFGGLLLFSDPCQVTTSKNEVESRDLSVTTTYHSERLLLWDPKEASLGAGWLGLRRDQAV